MKTSTKTIATLSLVAGLLSACSLRLLAGPVLTGEVALSDDCIFLPHEKPVLAFRISGLAPQAKGPDLRVRIVDERERELWRKDFPTLADKAGFDEIRVREIPCGRLGFYRVYAALADGTKLHSPWSTMRDGELTYAVVRDPKDREQVDESILCFFHSTDPRMVGHVHAYGAQDYSDMMWRHNEPNRPGQYANDPAAAARRIRPSLIYTSMDWSEADKKRYFKLDGHKGGIPALTAEGEKVWGDYVRALARNYRAQNPDHKPRLYELSSEWRHSDNGSRTMADVIRLYEIGYQAVHEEDPEGIVLGIGYDPYYYTTHDYLKAGLGKWLDAVAVHPYFNPDPVEPNGLVRKIRAAKKWMREYTGRDIPVYNTECGYATHWLAANEPVQMKHLTRMGLIFVGEGWKSLSIFVPFDYRGEAGFGLSYSLSLGRSHTDTILDFGAKRTAPKPAWPALSAMCGFVTNSKSCGDIPFLGETVWGYVFKHQKTGKVNLAVWDWSGKPNAVSLKVGRANVRVADHMGNLRTETCTDKGELSLVLEDMPTYVFDVDPEVWERPDGERVQLAAAFKAKQEAARRARGVLVKGLAPTAVGGRPAVEVTLEDTSAQPNAGEIAVRVAGADGSEGRLAYALAANETKTFVVPLGPFAVRPLIEEDVVATATMADGRTATRTDRTNFFIAPRAHIAVDGSFDDWKGVPLYPLDTVRNLAFGQATYGGAKDLSAEAAAAWDEKGLYFRFVVTDNDWQQPPASTMVWSRDSVQIALARVYRYEETSNEYLDLLTEARTEHAFGLTAEGPYVYRHTTFDNKTFPRGPVADGPDAPQVNGRVARNADGSWRIEYEVFVPWSNLSTKAPPVGSRLGWAFTINDTDAGKSYANVTMLGGFSLKFANKFGALILGE